MKLLSKPTVSFERNQVRTSRGMFHVRGRMTFSTVTIYAPEVLDNEKMWTVLKGETIGNLVVGEKIEQLTFGNIILLGVLVVSEDHNDIYECQIDNFIED